MQEFIGHCKACSKRIYCEDGFLNGAVMDDKSLICFDCLESGKSQEAAE